MTEAKKMTIDHEKIERIGLSFVNLLKYQKYLTKRVHPLIEKYGVYNVINHVNGHRQSDDLENELKPVIDELGAESVRGYAEVIKEELLQQQ